MMRKSRTVKLVPRLLAALGAAFTLSALLPVAGCISNFGDCRRQLPAVNQCAGRSATECESVPGCTSFSACAHHCFGLGQTDCAASSDCHWNETGSECQATDDPCTARSVATCTQNPVCKVASDCQGDVDCGSISDEQECRATNGCYYQQGVT